MADRPISFTVPMVKALLREIKVPGTGKTQTRRIHTTQEPEFRTICDLDCSERLARACCGVSCNRRKVTKARYRVGDRLYVREQWRCSVRHDDVRPRDLKPRSMTVFFEAGGSIANQDSDDDWRPVEWPGIPENRPRWIGRFRQGMHMPKWASRITLLVTEVRVQRLQDCSEADAIAEGITKHGRFFGVADADWDSASTISAVDAYANLWDDINGPGSWAANPWVVAISFTVHQMNIDAMEVAHASL